MSAPDTNIEKQAKRHKGPLVGIIAGLIFAGVLLFALITWMSANGNTPEGAETQVDGRTGEVVAGEEDATATE